MSLEADTFLIFSLKEATEVDPEVDFVINNVKYVAEAISTAGEGDLSDKEERLKAKFPRNMTMTTYRPLFRYIERAVQIRKHEAEMVAKGMPIDNTPQDRTYKALNWEGWDLKNDNDESWEKFRTKFPERMERFKKRLYGITCVINLESIE